MTLSSLHARIARLERLSIGLAREAHRARADRDLRAAEHRAYLAALYQALHGVETARVALAKAVWRLERSGSADCDGSAVGN